jgi:putative transposase
MPTILEVCKTYKYRLYTSKRDVRLHEQIDVAGHIWNHVTRLQKRYYRLLGKHINSGRMQKHIARRAIRVADKRYDFHFQLAHALCDEYNVLVFENLNIAAMKKLWGRKVSDLGFSQFLSIVSWVAFKRGKRFIQIGCWNRTTGKCSTCGHIQVMDLKDRTFCCQNPACGLVLERDHNAVLNIRELGHQLILSQSEEDLHSAGIRR